MREEACSSSAFEGRVEKGSTTDLVPWERVVSRAVRAGAGLAGLRLRGKQNRPGQFGRAAVLASSTRYRLPEHHPAQSLRNNRAAKGSRARGSRSSRWQRRKSEMIPYVVTRIFHPIGVRGACWQEGDIKIMP